EVRDVLELAGLDVVLELLTRVALERVRRVVGLEAGLQEVLRGRAGAAGDRAVDELDVRVLLVEDLDERVEAELLRARGPPGEDLDLVAAPVAAARVVAPVPLRVAAAGCQHEARRCHCSDHCRPSHCHSFETALSPGRGASSPAGGPAGPRWSNSWTMWGRFVNFREEVTPFRDLGHAP